VKTKEWRNKVKREGWRPGPWDGEPDDVWWFGFDCAHIGDVCPGMTRHYQSDHEKYKDIRYVESEVASLAKQLKAMETINDNHKPMREEG
jgi:hypothetical protein